MLRAPQILAARRRPQPQGVAPKPARGTSQYGLRGSSWSAVGRRGTISCDIIGAAYKWRSCPRIALLVLDASHSKKEFSSMSIREIEVAITQLAARSGGIDGVAGGISREGVGSKDRGGPGCWSPGRCPGGRGSGIRGRVGSSAMTHLTLPRFWGHYHRLPAHVQRLADKNYELLKADPNHPSLHFKKVGKTNQLWSVCAWPR